MKWRKRISSKNILLLLKLIITSSWSIIASHVVWMRIYMTWYSCDIWTVVGVVCIVGMIGIHDLKIFNWNCKANHLRDGHVVQGSLNLRRAFLFGSQLIINHNHGVIVYLRIIFPIWVQLNVLENTAIDRAWGVTIQNNNYRWRWPAKRVVPLSVMKLTRWFWPRLPGLSWNPTGSLINATGNLLNVS